MFLLLSFLALSGHPDPELCLGRIHKGGPEGLEKEPVVSKQMASLARKIQDGHGLWQPEELV